MTTATKDYYFIFDGRNEKTSLKVKRVYTECDYNWYKAKSKPVKATKQNIRLLNEYCQTHQSDYERCEYDCTGSTKTILQLRISKGKVWIKEHTSIDC